jgi:hypothetical protein
LKAMLISCLHYKASTGRKQRRYCDISGLWLVKLYVASWKSSCSQELRNKFKIVWFDMREGIWDDVDF